MILTLHWLTPVRARLENIPKLSRWQLPERKTNKHKSWPHRLLTKRKTIQFISYLNKSLEQDKNLVAFRWGGGCFSVVADPVITEESCCYWCQVCHVKCSEAHLRPSREHWLLGVNYLWTTVCHLQLRVILWIIRLLVFSTGTCTFLWVDEISKYLPFKRQTSTFFSGMKTSWSWD